MWIVTGGRSKQDPAVFLSVVQHWKRPDTLIVRARDRRSLNSLAAYAGKTINHTPTGHDYPYRVQVLKGTLAEFLYDRVMEIDYHNVKDRVTQTRGQHWHDVLMRVWAAMRGLMPQAKVRSFADYFRRQEEFPEDETDAILGEKGNS